MSNNLIIRGATEDDISTIAQFNRAMALETENKELDPETAEAGVEAILSDPAKGFYLVAEYQDEIVGTLMITTEWSDWRNSRFWWVQSVYILPDARRQGIYTALHNQVRALAEEEEEVCGIRLYVDRENRPAQKAYESLGMAPAHYRMYEEMLSEEEEISD